MDLPPVGIALIILLDDIFGMRRAVVNAGGDTVGSVVIARRERGDLEANATAPRSVFP